MMIFGMVVSQKALDYSYYLTLLFNLFVMVCSAIYFYKTRRQSETFWFCHGPLICVLIGMSLLQLDPLKNATMTACRVALQPAYAKYGFEPYVEKILGFLFLPFLSQRALWYYAVLGYAFVLTGNAIRLGWFDSLQSKASEESSCSE